MRAPFSLWDSIRQYLIPHIEEALEPLTEKEAEFVRAAELAGVERFVRGYMWRGNGRRSHPRKALALAFIAKAVWNLPTTRALLEFLRAPRTVGTLCGWERAEDVPSKVTFSRAFAAFAADRLPERIHGAMVEAGLGDGLVGHMSVDSTAVEAREAAAPKGEAEEEGKGKRKRKAPKRLDVQPARSPGENLADLPARCGRGVKRNSRGNVATWTGYKLHLAVADGGVPMCAALTSASTHDSQVAVPLVQMGAERATVLYVLADSAYDAEAIRAHIRSWGQVPIIEPNRRNGGARRLDPAERARYGERTTVERVNAWLKDCYGGRFVRVRGAAKVMAHLMFGVIALTAARLFALTG